MLTQKKEWLQEIKNYLILNRFCFVWSVSFDDLKKIGFLEFNEIKFLAKDINLSAVMNHSVREVLFRLSLKNKLETIPDIYRAEGKILCLYCFYPYHYHEPYTESGDYILCDRTVIHA